MKKVKWAALAGTLLLILMTSACWFGNVTVTILQTSDVHHHASGYGPYLDYTPMDTTDGDEIMGGYARLATLIKSIREEQKRKCIPTMVFDSGDFTMGTVYDLTAADPISLKFFQMMKYDAITLGNHEFDWGPQGLAMLLSNAVANGFTVPVVATNMVVPEDNVLQGIKDAGIIVGTKVLQHTCGVKLGIIGLMGPDSDSKAPVAAPVTFNHDYAFIQQQVDYLKKTRKVDVVIALSHGGVENSGKGDDADLASNITGIDIIASGHYHTATGEPLVIGPSKTIIFSPGEYGKYLSRLDVTYNIFTRKLVDYEFTLIPVDDSVEGDPQIQAVVDAYNAQIGAALSSAGLPDLDAPITTTSFALEKSSFQVTGIGSLAADSLRAVANGLLVEQGLNIDTSPPTPFHVGVVASGVIRDDIYPGKTGIVTFSDVYNMLPLGISPYDPSVPGYPLMSVYASGEDVYTICEVALTLAPQIGSDYYLNFSGLSIDYDISGAPMFQGVHDVGVYNPGDSLCMGDTTPVDPDGMYRIVVDLYALQMLYIVNDYLELYGLPTIEPLYPSRIDRDLAEGVQELKEWMAPLFFLPMIGTTIPEAIYGPGGLAMGRVY